MNNEPPRLPLLERREIEARIVGPLLRAFAAEIGQERTLAIVRKWFNFMIAKDIIKTLSPCAGVEAPAPA